MSGTMDDDGQACLCFACALEDDVPAGLPVGATSAGLGWRRERSYKVAEQIARRSSRGITGVHHQHKSPLDDNGPRTLLQSTSGPLVQRCPICCYCYLPANLLADSSTIYSLAKDAGII